MKKTMRSGARQGWKLYVPSVVVAVEDIGKVSMIDDDDGDD